MRKFLAICLLWLMCVPALAQWQVPNHAAPVGKGPGVTGFTGVGPCAANQSLVWSSASADPACTTIRPALSGNLTYYVRTDGSDSNTCLANTAAGACLTIQHAADLAVTWDLNGPHAITIQIGDGNYTSGVTVTGPLASGSALNLVFQGNTGNSSAVTVADSAQAFCASSGANFTVKYVKIQNSTLGVCALIQSFVYLSNVVFGTGNSINMYVTRQSYMEMIGPVSVLGSVTSIIESSHQGNFRNNSQTLTIGGDITVDNTIGGFYVDSLGEITFTGTASISTGGHTVTGRRYFIDQGSNIHTTTLVADPNFFPGTIAGAISGNGSYDFTSPRTVLIANKTIYVLTTGSDTLCVGNASASAASAPNCAFATIGAAYNYAVGKLDFGGYTVTISVSGETYSSASGYVNSTAPIVGGNPSTLLITGAGSGSTILQATAFQTMFSVNGANTGFTISGIKITGSNSAGESSIGMAATNYGKIIIGADFDYGDFSNGGVHNAVSQFGELIYNNNFTISGGAANHWQADHMGLVAVNGRTATLTGTPQFNKFAVFAFMALLRADSFAFTGAFHSSANQCEISTNAVAQTNSASLTYFPGDSGSCVVIAPGFRQ